MNRYSPSISLLLVLAAGYGCSEPMKIVDPPPIHIGIDWPESTVTLVRLGLENGNREQYVEAFADTADSGSLDFHALFDSADVADLILAGQQPPTDWVGQNERTFFPLFIGLRAVSYRAFFLPDSTRPSQFSDPDSDVTIFRRYRVWAGEEPLAVGRAELRIQRTGIDNHWKITRWEDHRDTTDTGIPTLGWRRLESLSYGS